jgi:hypothetical protein
MSKQELTFREKIDQIISVINHYNDFAIIGTRDINNYKDLEKWEKLEYRGYFFENAYKQSYVTNFGDEDGTILFPIDDDFYIVCEFNNLK